MNEETPTTKPTGQNRRRRSILVTGGVALAGLAATVVLYGATSASTSATADPSRPIRADQTDGYGDGKLLTFTYGEQYQCVHEPNDDRNFNGVPADRDPGEFQKPICQVNAGVGIDPAGQPTSKTEPLYVIVPFFDADNDGEAAGGLAPTLQTVFGFVPDAFDPTPGVPVQCPEPGGNLTAQKGEFGTCTMHPTALDYGPLLAAVRPDIFPPDKLANLDLPLVNHSHIIEGKNFKPIWWQLKVVLVTDQAAWPDVNATTGIRSVADINAAQAAGKALPTIDTNFFLFFGSREMKMKM
jgi:hypothetical protein